jgi:hypothetical protein
MLVTLVPVIVGGLIGLAGGWLGPSLLERHKEKTEGRRKAGALPPGTGPRRFAAFAGPPETARRAWFLAMRLPFDAFGSEFSG